MSSSSDSRTETSSSTTKTIDVTSGMARTSFARAAVGGLTVYGAAYTFLYTSLPCSPHPKRGIECVEQGRLAERLEQARHGALREHARAYRLISGRGDEDDRNLLLPPRQFLLEIESRHSRHRNVEDQAPGPADKSDCEERLGGREGYGGKPELPQQVGQRLAHRLVIVDTDTSERSAVTSPS